MVFVVSEEYYTDCKNFILIREKCTKFYLLITTRQNRHWIGGLEENGNMKANDFVKLSELIRDFLSLLCLCNFCNFFQSKFEIVFNFFSGMLLPDPA